MARELRVSRAAVTKTLQILERKGLVTLPRITVIGELALTAAGEAERAKGKT
jgi:Mn-dependent DtxR family transcriptional regulator